MIHLGQFYGILQTKYITRWKAKVFIDVSGFNLNSNTGILQWGTQIKYVFNIYLVFWQYKNKDRFNRMMCKRKKKRKKESIFKSIGKYYFVESLLAHDCNSFLNRTNLYMMKRIY